MYFFYRLLFLLLALQLTIAPIKAVSDLQEQTFFKFISNASIEGWSAAPANDLSKNMSDIRPMNTIIDDALLKEFECQTKNRQILTRGQRKIFIDAYQFATADGAYGAYCAGHKGSSNRLALTDASSEDPDSISFCKDKYFVYIYSSEIDDDEAKTAISKLALQLISYFKPQQDLAFTQIRFVQPEIFKLMPRLERVSGSEKLVMGSASLKKFFPAPFNSYLSGMIRGAVADYKIEDPDRDRLKLLIANYPSAQQAKLTLDNYLQLLRANHKEKSAENYPAQTFLFKLTDRFLLCQLRNDRIIVIVGARHKDSLRQLASRIYFN